MVTSEDIDTFVREFELYNNFSSTKGFSVNSKEIGLNDYYNQWLFWPEIYVTYSVDIVKISSLWISYFTGSMAMITWKETLS